MGEYNLLMNKGMMEPLMVSCLLAQEMVIETYVQTQLAGAVEYTDCISAEGWDSLNKCPGYDITYSDGEAPVMLELWGMQRTPLLPLLPALIFKLCPNKWLMLNWIVWNRTVWSFNCVETNN